MRCAPSEDRDIVTRRKVEADQTTVTGLLVVFVQQPANLVRLHAHNWIRLGIEIDPSVIDLNPDQVLIQLVSVTEKGLFGDKLEEPSLLGRVHEVLALQDSAQFFAPLEARAGRPRGVVN